MPRKTSSKHSLQSKYAIALAAAGFREEKPTALYRVFQGVYPAFNGAGGYIWIYLGRSGAVRFNRHGKISKGSSPIDPRTTLFRELLSDVLNQSKERSADFSSLGI